MGASRSHVTAGAFNGLQPLKKVLPFFRFLPNLAAADRRGLLRFPPRTAIFTPFVAQARLLGLRLFARVALRAPRWNEETKKFCSPCSPRGARGASKGAPLSSKVRSHLNLYSRTSSASAVSRCRAGNRARDARKAPLYASLALPCQEESRRPAAELSPSLDRYGFASYFHPRTDSGLIRVGLFSLALI